MENSCVVTAAFFFGHIPGNALIKTSEGCSVYTCETTPAVHNARRPPAGDRSRKSVNSVLVLFTTRFSTLK